MTNEVRERDKQQFIAAAGWGEAKRAPIPGDASFRHYERLSHSQNGDEKRAILMDAPPAVEEVKPFLHVCDILKQRDCSAPQILAEDVPQGFILLEDFGDGSFSRLIREDAAQEQMLYHAAIDALVKLRERGAEASVPTYDMSYLEREVALLGEWLFPALFGDARATVLHQEFMALWHKVAKNMPLQPEVLVHRDYHADNLFFLKERKGHQAVGMIDFQDALSGRAAYDVVSLLEDVRRHVSPEVVESSLSRYIDAAGVDEESFRRDYAFYGMQRNAKILGIFMRLYKRDGKEGYLSYMPRVWTLFSQDLEHPMFADIKDWVMTHIDAEAVQRIMQPEQLKEEAA